MLLKGAGEVPIAGGPLGGRNDGGVTQDVPSERSDDFVRTQAPVDADALKSLRVRSSKRSNVHRVREAQPCDAEIISAIASEYDIRNPEVAANPENGWLFQSASPDQVREAMGTYKDYWLAEDRHGEVVGYQVVCPPRYICRGFANHHLFGPDAEMAQRVLNSGRFIYASQLCVKKGAAKPGAAGDMQSMVLKHYRPLPLVCHVGCFMADEFADWDHEGPFTPRTNNVASHRFHQKQGYRLVGFASSVHDPALHSGQFEKVPGTEHTAALYVNFRDGAELRYAREDYVDPVTAIVDNPIRGEGFAAERLDLRVPWKGFEIDPFQLFEQTPAGFLPSADRLAEQMAAGAAAELRSLRRRLG